MITTPYIFLSKNYLKNSVYENGTPTADLESLFSQDIKDVFFGDEMPKEIIIFFTDIYGSIINRNIDTLILQNTNIRDLQILAANNSGIYSSVFSIVDNEEKELFLQIPQKITTSSIKIIISAANESFYSIGKLSLCGEIVKLYAKASLDFSFEAAAGNFRTAAGDLIHFTDFIKWNAGLSIDNVPKDNFDVIKSEILDEKELTIIPFKNFEIQDIYECYIAPSFKYTVDMKSELYSINLSAKQL